MSVLGRRAVVVFEGSANIRNRAGRQGEKKGETNLPTIKLLPLFLQLLLYAPISGHLLPLSLDLVGIRRSYSPLTPSSRRSRYIHPLPFGPRIERFNLPTPRLLQGHLAATGGEQHSASLLGCLAEKFGVSSGEEERRRDGATNRQIRIVGRYHVRGGVDRDERRWLLFVERFVRSK